MIVWDAERGVEHFVRKPIFQGDPKSFGFFVPTPVVPAVAKADEAILDRVASLVPSAAVANAPGLRLAGGGGAPPVEVLQRVAIDDFELVTLKAARADELGEWLAKNGFADRPELRRWSQRYLSRGWLVNAMKYAGSQGAAPRKLEAPTVRLSFAIDRPFYPYTEPDPDAAAERAFAMRAPRGLADIGQDAPAIARPFDLWVVARDALSAYQGSEALGPARAGSATVTTDALARALGDTKPWGFEPSGSYVVTHFHDQSARRSALDDLRFGAEAPSIDAPVAEEPAPSRARPLLFVIALAIAAALGFAFSDMETKRRDERR